MNIHITCTPEFSPAKLKEIVELLSSVPGEMTFHELEPFSIEQAAALNEKFENINQIKELSFRELFDYVKTARIFGKVKKEDSVIVITSINNDEEWFSAFDGNNIFVHGDEWDLIANADSKFGIAHQCIENIFQSLIHLNIDDYKKEPNIHEPSIGCINDFCDEKHEILLKLKTADICDSCYDRAIKEGVGVSLLTQISGVQEKIREQFIFTRNFKRTYQTETIVVDKDGNVSIGGKSVDIKELPRSLYIHFLLNLDGIASQDLCSHREKIKKIYEVLTANKRYVNDSTLVSMCCSKVPEGVKMMKVSPTLSANRNRIKEPIADCIGDILCNLYLINIITTGNKEKFLRINIDKDKIKISPKFLQKICM